MLILPEATLLPSRGTRYLSDQQIMHANRMAVSFGERLRTKCAIEGPFGGVTLLAISMLIGYRLGCQS